MLEKKDVEMGYHLSLTVAQDTSEKYRSSDTSAAGIEAEHAREKFELVAVLEVDKYYLQGGYNRQP